MRPDAPIAEPPDPALQAAHAQLRDVLDGIGEAFYAIDREWRLVHVSRKALELWGKQADEVVGRTLLDVFPHAAGTEPYRAQQRAFETGRPEHLEAFSPALDRWIEMDVTPGKTGLSVALRDIDTRRRAEQALRESEERWRLVVESATDYAIITTDQQGRVTSWSPGAMRVLGWPEAEMLGHDASLIFTPEDRAAGAPEQEMRTALATGRAADERWHLHRDGSRFWGTGQLTPLRDRAVRGFLKIMRDNTGRRQAEEALAAAHARTMNIIESIDDQFYIVDRDWRLTHVGRRTLEAWGKRLEEVIGRPLVEVLPQLAGSEPLRIQMEAAAEGRAVECEVVSPVLRRWISLRVHPVGEAGTLIYFRDIHVRKEMEEALRASEDRFRSFAENSADVLWIMDPEMRRLIYISPAFERIWGEPRDAVMRDLSRWAELVHPEDAERAATALPRLLAGGTHVAEYRIRRPDGGVRWIRDTGFPIRDAGGRIARVAGIAQDVTDEREVQEALRGSEARLRILSETIPQLVWTSLADGQWNWAGPQWQAFTGLSEPESLGHCWYTAVHPDDRERAEAAWREASGEGRSGSLDVEMRIRRHDGTWRWFQTRAAPLSAEGGAGLRWFGTCTDVDDLKRAEQAVRDREARFRAVADAMPQILWSALPDGHIDYYNRRWHEYTGLSRARTKSRGWTEALHRDDLARTLERYERSLQTGENYEAECRLRGIDGSYRWFIARAVPVRDAERRITRWFGTCTDLDDIVRAREVLARDRQQLEELVAGRTADLRQAVDALHTEVLERERAEETLRQSQKMEAVGQLTGGIAHDFNNMLQGVIGGLEMVQRRIAEGRFAETARYIEASRKAVERAAALTNRLLAFARRQALDPQPLDADRLVVSMEELIRRTAGPEIEVELRPSGRVATGSAPTEGRSRCADGSPSAMGDGDWMVLCDANQLENALLNLCINARDAMPDGGRLAIGTQHVSLSATELAGQDAASPGDYVAVVVSDSGTGMPPEVLARAFEPFFTTKPMGQGTGLGLSQIYGFVQQSNGIVQLESAPGRGTTVRLFLPRYEPVRADEKRGVSASEPERGSGETVLLVEDEATVRELAAEHLRELGYEVLEAGDGPAALRLLRGASRVDLLVTDVGLPGGLNGRQVADAARERRPGLKVLFITGYAGGALDGPLGPRTELIGKPFTLDALASRVGAMLAAGRSDPSGGLQRQRGDGG